jgi:DNA-binding transcriptional ArsR family regulator
MVMPMNGEADLAAIGSLLADRTRATILLTLLNGGLTSASALAARADVSASLASNHLRKLTEGGLVVVEPQGRQRMYRLGSQGIAQALEALIPLAPLTKVQSLRGVHERDGLRRGRLCYDHLAGRVGVALTRGLVESGWLEEHEESYIVTNAGMYGFADFGIDVPTLMLRARPLTRACADWSEHRPHLAGSLGAAMTAELFRLGWLDSREASRVVALNETGRDELSRRFGIDADSFELPAEAAVAA